jgi:hypothetical protein
MGRRARSVSSRLRVEAAEALTGLKRTDRAAYDAVMQVVLALVNKLYDSRR